MNETHSVVASGEMACHSSRVIPTTEIGVFKRLRLSFLFGLALCFFFLPSLETAGETPPFTRGELESWLAPIALWPDPLLSRILMAATYPLEVVEASRWLVNHPGLEGEAAMDAADDKPWDESIKSLLAVPWVLHQMDSDLEWTRNLGDAFLLQPEEVMETIQDLRARARASGHLGSLDHVTVREVRENIIIEPLQTRIVYFPFYDPWVVFGSWRWSSHPPICWYPVPVQASVARFTWSHPHHVPVRFYYANFSWPKRQIVMVGRGQSQRSSVHGGSGYFRTEREILWKHDPTHRRGVDYRGNWLHQSHFGTGTSGSARATVPEARRDWQTHYAVRQRQDGIRREALERRLAIEQAHRQRQTESARAVARPSPTPRQIQPGVSRPPAAGSSPAFDFQRDTRSSRIPENVPSRIARRPTEAGSARDRSSPAGRSPLVSPEDRYIRPTGGSARTVVAEQNVERRAVSGPLPRPDRGPSAQSPSRVPRPESSRPDSPRSTESFRRPSLEASGDGSRVRGSLSGHPTRRSEARPEVRRAEPSGRPP